MAVLSNPAGFLLSGTLASGGGQPMDARHCKNYGYLEYATCAPSALLAFEASKDRTGWMRIATYTGTPTTASAQVSAFYPYVRGVYITGWSTTASANLFFAPGL